MSGFIALLESWGYAGMLISSFIAGSVFPFSSEVVLTALLLAGLKPWPLFFCATAGNVAGSMFNYFVGSLGRMEWIERYLHVPEQKVRATSEWMQHYGAWIGVLCFLPIIGSVIAVALGFTRANPWLSLLAISIGKAGRYLVLVFAISLI